MSIRTSHNVAKTVKKSGENGRGGVWRYVYGPSLVRSVEFGASKGPGGGNAEALAKLPEDNGAEGEGVISVEAVEEKVTPVAVVSIDACGP